MTDVVEYPLVVVLGSVGHGTIRDLGGADGTTTVSSEKTSGYMSDMY